VAVLVGSLNSLLLNSVSVNVIQAAAMFTWAYHCGCRVVVINRKTEEEEEGGLGWWEGVLGVSERREHSGLR